MEKKTKTIIAVAGTIGLVYLAYKFIPKILGSAPSTGCNGSTCTGYPCETINKWIDSQFPNNVDDNGNPIYTEKCRYSKFRDNPELMTAWADAILSKSGSFKVKGETYCTETANNVNDPNSGSTNGKCPTCIFAGRTDCQQDPNYCQQNPNDC